MYLQLNGSTAAPRFADSPELEARGGSDGPSFPSVGVIGELSAVGVNSREPSAVENANANFREGSVVENANSGTNGREASGADGIINGCALASRVYDVTSGRSMQLSRSPVGGGGVMLTGFKYGAPLESGSNVGDALISTDASDERGSATYDMRKCSGHQHW